MIKSIRETEWFVPIIRLVIVLFSIDVLFTLAGVINWKLGYPNYRWSITMDYSYPEYFQYLKEFLAALLLLMVARKTRNAHFYVWVFLVAYLFSDDAFRIHENAGHFVEYRTSWDSLWGLRDQDYGEFASALIAGTVFMISLAIVFKKGTAFFKKPSVALLVIILLLAFCGIILDMLTIIALDHRGPRFEIMMAILEDGGEMFVISILVAYSYFLLRTCEADPVKFEENSQPEA